MLPWWYANKHSTNNTNLWLGPSIFDTIRELDTKLKG
jgi:hypothetical protein